MTLLDQPYDLTPQQIEQFRADGFIKLKNVFDQPTLDAYGGEITRLTLDLNPHKDKPMDQRDTYGKAFIQVGNLWRKSDKARAFSFSRRLARIATELLGTRGVRMYHDQALYKEPAGGFTPWHADQQYWPLETGKSVTVWIPLQAVPMDMGPLAFAKGSHLKNIGRDIEISDASETLIRDEVKKHRLIEVMEPYDLGEVSFHLGWTLHRAGGNTTTTPRKVHTVIYIDSEMRLAEPKNDYQKADRDAFSPGTQVGEVMDSALNPILYEQARQNA